jgi:cholesterol transport system auxiliary component
MSYRLLSAVLLLSLSACSVLPERAPTKIYALTPPTVAAIEAPAVNWALLVPRPIADQTLDSDRILVRPAAGEIQTYKGAAWTDAVPELVQSALVRGFEDSGKILSVARPGAGVRGRYQLLTELRAFEAVYAQAGRPEAIIELQAKLIDTKTSEVVAMRGFRETQAADSEQVGAVVAAFSVALNRLSSGVIDWTLTSPQRASAEATDR